MEMAHSVLKAIDMKLHSRALLVPLLCIAAAGSASVGCSAELGDDAPEPETTSNLSASTARCDVIVAGGTTAALAAAFASADEGSKTCLIEPTDWTGGQLTASAVPAVDEAWHSVGSLNVAAIARMPANNTPSFGDLVRPIGNPGGCWVSRFCYEPKNLLTSQIFPAEGRRKPNLTIYRNTVVRRAEARNGSVERLVGVRRSAKGGWGGYDALLSSDVADWYSPRDSSRYTKEVITFEGNGGRAPVFIDATEWGEVLALTQASYLQGVDVTDGSQDSDDTCGQSTVYGFVEKMESGPVDEPNIPSAARSLLEQIAGVDPPSYAFYSLNTGSGQTDAQKWNEIFTYRRLRGQGSAAKVGDLALQNWNPGNDYPFGYLFLSKARTRDQVARDAWVGGIDIGVLAGAEKHAYGWHRFFKARGAIAGKHVKLDTTVLGTSHGLAKLPYIRDTRRSVGLDGFVLRMADIAGEASAKTGKRFRDRVAIGAYNADVHPLRGCRYPAHVKEYDVLPFYVPFRALTNESYGNLLVAGKTMAQSFMANAATRLHPIEWASGTAAGVAAASMSQTGRSSRAMLDRVDDLQAKVRPYTPTEWTIEGRSLPASGETTLW
jgi:hypothetical protein